MRNLQNRYADILTTCAGRETGVRAFVVTSGRSNSCHHEPQVDPDLRFVTGWSDGALLSSIPPWNSLFSALNQIILELFWAELSEKENDLYQLVEANICSVALQRSYLEFSAEVRACTYFKIKHNMSHMIVTEGELKCNNVMNATDEAV